MPPVRTASTSSASMAAALAAKPLKTERTHEENQERAYIAASRRSDRSLEARVESARRASEIHKRRTGRSLRVTEQDVINEEMYEEEDDDLPMQYRRLTAHLHTSNAEFDRRLAAYLTNHVAMRAALGQAVGMQNQPYPNAAQFANNNYAGNPLSSFPQQSLMGPPSFSASSFLSGGNSASPSQPTMNSPIHKRSASIANTADVSANGTSEIKDRRNSLPPRKTSPTGSDGQPAGKRLKSIHNLKLENLPKPMDSMSPFKSEFTTPLASQSQSFKPSDFPAPFDMSSFNPIGNAMNSMPFSTALPLETQQLLGGAFDSNDAMTAMFMGGRSQQMQPDYSYDSGFNKASMFTNMDQTLAPGFLDTSVGGFDADDEPKSTINSASDFATSAGPNDSSFDEWPKFNPFSNEATSGQATPTGDRDWQSFIDGNMWGDDSSSQLSTQ